MKIALVGDIGLFGRFCLKENDALEDYFSDVKSLFSQYDIVVGNLETPFVEKVTPYGVKSAHIFSKTDNIKLLEYLGFDYLNLANNHIYDFGFESYELTKKLLGKAGIQYFGVEGKQCLVNIDGEKVALHGYCSYNTNPQKMTLRDTCGINTLDVDLLTSNMSRNYQNGYFNIVSIHSGQEHVNYPSLDDIELARKLADKMPYVYYGHHPHVIQGVEIQNDSVLAYSLGNFCFSDVFTKKSDEPLVVQSENNKTGLILSLELTGNRVKSSESIPIYMGKDKLYVGHSDLQTLGLGIDLEGYSAALNMDRNEYQSMRNQQIIQFINSRKQMRNLHWYIKRLNWNSVKQIFQARQNAKKYYLHVKSKLA